MKLPITLHLEIDADALAAFALALGLRKDAAPPQAGALDLAALGKALDVSPATLRRLVAEGLPHVAVGRARRFDLDAVRAWLAARPSAPARPRPAHAKAMKPTETDAEIERIGELAGLRLVRPR
jgi:excisionase family DNA binding protein